MPVKDSTHDHFKTALDALKRGTPKRAELAEKYKDKMRKISVADVALEAGHSRRLLYLCRDLLDAIESANRERRPARNAGETISRLRNENYELREKLAKALSESAALHRYARALEDGKVTAIKRK